MSRSLQDKIHKRRLSQRGLERSMSVHRSGVAGVCVFFFLLITSYIQYLKFSPKLQCLVKSSVNINVPYC